MESFNTALSLEAQKGVVEEIAEVEFGAAPTNFGMFADKEPADMGEEEAAVDVVGVGGRVGPLVVTSVVAHPFDNIVLERHAIGEHENQPRRPARLVAPVRP